MLKSLFTSALFSISLLASEVSWFHSYSQAAQVAKQNQKPMLVFMNKPGCGSCQYMKENVFTNQSIIEYLNAHYVSISLDINTNDAPQKLQVKVTPVFHFLTSSGEKSIETLIGGKTAPYFLKLLKKGNTGAQ